MNDLARPVYHDLLRNTKTILSAFYYHPDTAASTLAWAHDAMCAEYAQAVSDLADMDGQWHFVASQTDPEQIINFRLEDMAHIMEMQAPMLWTLIGCLLRGTRNSKEAEGLRRHGSTSTISESSGEMDSEDEYWEDDDDKCIESMGKERVGTASTSATRRGRRLTASRVQRIRTVVILSILVQMNNQKSNALQSIVGIFLHACNTPEKVVKLLSRMGISISLTSIHRAVRSLSEQTDQNMYALGRSLLASFAYDNFELQLSTCIPTIKKPAEGLLHLTSGVLVRLEHGVTLEDLRCSHLIWERSSLNPRARDPRPFDAHQTMEFLYTLHPDTSHPASSLSWRGRFRVRAVQNILLEHGLPGLKALLGDLKMPESVDAIPLVKTHYVPLRTMDLNQSKISDNIAAIQEMFKQAGVGDVESGGVDISEFVTLIHGDLGTYERVLSAVRRRSVEESPYNRLQSVIFIIGLFHLKMAAADAIWRILVSPDNARVDETSFMRLVGRLRPQESSRLVANAKFRQQHELINHVLTVLVLDAWRTEVKKRTQLSSLEEWAATKPSSADIEDVAVSLVQDYIEGAGLDIFELEGRPSKERDQVRENTMRTMHYLLLYEELCYSLNAGDVGRFETILPHWISIFRATGKHKYGTHTLRFLHALYFIYLIDFVNLSGKPHEFRPVDWLVELLNLYTKVIYGGEGSNYTKARIILESVLVAIYRSSHANLERNFYLAGLTHKHASKDMKQTFTVLLEYLKTVVPNEYVAGRRSAYSIPNIFVHGAGIIAAESACRTETDRVDDGLSREKEAMGEEIDEVEEDFLDVELSAEDLRVEGTI
ncbi:hypothetical protein BN946_scf184970.g98 [Trametes cinnabarina]|uniref:DUF6589 domain-containing protein n=1 Tax=Pycnoporus cinnabarinus TaxID=5643 RepID=A0A060SDF0_PYCCI|nr:hypothetical protein BN946_scf184970.g98 [Trametes cinnabarina]